MSTYSHDNGLSTTGTHKYILYAGSIFLCAFNTALYLQTTSQFSHSHVRTGEGSYHQFAHYYFTMSEIFVAEI